MMTPQDQVPEYRVLVRSFFAPDTVEAGSIIRYDGAPGNHLEPLNEAAAARLEEWYDEETDEIDPKTRVPTGKKLRPHAGFRPARYEASEAAAHHVLSVPDANDTSQNIQTLAEITAARKSTNQRPPAASVPKKVIDVKAAAAPPPPAIAPGNRPAEGVK